MFPPAKDPKPAPDVHDDDLENDVQYTARTLPSPVASTRTTPVAGTPPPEGAETPKDTSTLRSDFQRKREERLRAQQAEQAATTGHSGWRAELGAYRQTLEDDVSPDTDLCEWWQDHAHLYPTVACMALDFIPAQASSVSAEFLFSGSSQTADDRRARLSAQIFEELQISKDQWKRNVVDYARQNQLQVGMHLPEMIEFEDLAAEEEREAELDKALGLQ